MEVDRRQFLLALAAAPVALRHEPLAYVTADTEAHVVLVGMTSGRVFRRIPTAPSPFSIERVGDTAVVAHTVGAAVTFDLIGMDSQHFDRREVIGHSASFL